MIIYNEFRLIMDRLRHSSVRYEHQKSELTVSILKGKLIQELCLKSNKTEINKAIRGCLVFFNDVRLKYFIEAKVLSRESKSILRREDSVIMLAWGNSPIN